jgi:NADPH:quinone reductase-like Zn-dependent oxidoreductase
LRHDEDTPTTPCGHLRAFEDLAELARLVDAGAVEVIVDSMYPFERIGDAMAKLEEGRAKGKIVVTMPDDEPFSPLTE